MKHNGANMEFAAERFRDLMTTYDNYLRTCQHIRMDEVYQHVATSPARRFYVSETRATIVVTDMLHGRNPLASMRPLKQAMFREIYRRVTTLRDRHPTATIRHLCAKVIQQPAPSFYITPGSVKIIVCKGRKKWIQEKAQRLRRLLSR